MDESDILYKYRTWNCEYHKNVLTNNELFYAPPIEMNDPFDCKIPIDYSQLDTNDKKISYINILLRDSKHILKQQGISEEYKRLELLARLTHDMQNMEEEYDRTNFRWTDMRFGVISFSRRWNSILMWSHYSDNHKGFCIGFNKEKIIKSSLYGAAGNVSYEDSYPSIDILSDEPIRELYKLTHFKAKDWNYEEEFRLAQLWSENNPSIKDRIIHLPDNFLAEILLGMMIPEEHKKEILDIASNKKIPVYQVRKMRKAVLLERERIL